MEVMKHRDTELEELLAKYGAGTRTGSRFQTPERSTTPKYSREGWRDEDVRSIKHSESRSRSILTENSRRPSPIRHDNDFSRTPSSPLSASKGPISRLPNESKAYSMAMKALQDRVKQLELENERLMMERSRDSGGMHLNVTGKNKDLVENLKEELREKTMELKNVSEELKKALDIIDRLQSEKIPQTRKNDIKTPPNSHFSQLRIELENQKKHSFRMDDMLQKRESLNRRKRLEDDFGRYVVTEGDCLESTRTAYFGEIRDGKEQRLEQELAECNEKYKSVLVRSQTPGADIFGLRAELNTLSGVMETKKEELDAYRRCPTLKSFDYA